MKRVLVVACAGLLGALALVILYSENTEPQPQGAPDPRPGKAQAEVRPQSDMEHAVRTVAEQHSNTDGRRSELIDIIRDVFAVRAGHETEDAGANAGGSLTSESAPEIAIEEVIAAFARKDFRSVFKLAATLDSLIGDRSRKASDAMASELHAKVLADPLLSEGQSQGPNWLAAAVAHLVKSENSSVNCILSEQELKDICVREDVDRALKAAALVRLSRTENAEAFVDCILEPTLARGGDYIGLIETRLSHGLDPSFAQMVAGRISAMQLQTALEKHRANQTANEGRVIAAMVTYALARDNADVITWVSQTLAGREPDGIGSRAFVAQGCAQALRVHADSPTLIQCVKSYIDTQLVLDHPHWNSQLPGMALYKALGQASSKALDYEALLNSCSTAEALALVEGLDAMECARLLPQMRQYVDAHQNGTESDASIVSAIRGIAAVKAFPHVANRSFLYDMINTADDGTRGMVGNLELQEALEKARSPAEIAAQLIRLGPRAVVKPDFGMIAMWQTTLGAGGESKALQAAIEMAAMLQEKRIAFKTRLRLWEAHCSPWGAHALSKYSNEYSAGVNSLREECLLQKHPENYVFYRVLANWVVNDESSGDAFLGMHGDSVPSGLAGEARLCTGVGAMVELSRMPRK